MCFFSLGVVCSLVPFCTRPVYFRVVLFSTPFFGLFIKFAFYRSKKKKKNIFTQVLSSWPISHKGLRNAEILLGC